MKKLREKLAYRQNAALRAIFGRRSVRAYANRAVGRMAMDIILQAGRCAPSAWDNQSCNFVVLINKRLINRLAEVTANHLGGGAASHNFFGAHNLILIHGARDCFDLRYDTGAAMQNMFIAAKSLGIGSVWVNQLVTINDQPDVVALLGEMGIPQTHIVSAIAVFGYAAETPQMSERKSTVRIIE